MQDLNILLRKLVVAQANEIMPNESFYTYLEEHPSLHTVISSAMREGDATAGILDVNFPKNINVNQKDALVVLNLLNELALWLVTAGKKHGFTILGETGKTAPPPAAPPKKTFAKRHQKPEKPCDDLPATQKKLKVLCAKVGGVDKLKKTIQDAYDSTHSQYRTAELLKKNTGLDISQEDISRWMRILNLRVNPQMGGRKVTLKKNLRKADVILRQKAKMGLVAFIRRERANHLKQIIIIRKIKRLTGIPIAAASMSHLIKRLKIR